MYHIPVMLSECIEALNIHPSGTYVDVTYGGGGHSTAILSKLNTKGKLIAFDQDEEAKRNIPADKRLLFIDQNFAFLETHLLYQNLVPVDGILADLGVSSHQFDTDYRGFSYRFEEADLDMRMNSGTSLSAYDIINTYQEDDLSKIFYTYGELKNARKIAAHLVHQRGIHKIKTVADLKNVLKAFAPKHNDYKFWSQVFQALRIEVNKELEVLKNLLEQATHVLKENGTLVVMSYHSLEDRLVKNYFNSGNFDGAVQKDFYGNIQRPLHPENKKAIQASEEEIAANPRARSAKLRIAKKNKVQS